MNLDFGTGQEKQWRETGLHNNSAGNNSLYSTQSLTV
jgi:hypothetical protein